MTPRPDATRSRARILDAARDLPPESLRLNDVAHRAGVGVATVYRHFPTVHALVEALTETDLARYSDLARRACAEPDALRGLDLLVRDGLALQLAGDGLQAVLLADRDTSADVTAVKDELLAAVAAVVTRAVAAGVVRPDLTPGRLQHLVCGVEHAVRVAGGGPDEREFHLAAALAGLRAGAPAPER
ncbi:TetR/AcrR family transcriptional regulator [Kineococcus sp. SYSU DK001]|uniref:TetR/AcrR family transcriptional regulator n=1 Tax=Kineococcus sp. SYSU DK001 TaxID=3383122 RepID=UPI003D7C4939